MDTIQRDRSIYTSCIIVMLGLCTLLYITQCWFEVKTGYIFGKSDIRNYYDDIGKKNPSYFQDQNHYIINKLFKIFGYPFTTSYIMVFGSFILYLFYFKGFYTIEKSFLATFMAFFGTSLLTHILYVGVFSQALANMFFIMMLIGERQKNTKIEIGSGLLMCATHGMSAIVPAFYNMLHFIKYKDKKKIIYSFMYLIFFILVWTNKFATPPNDKDVQDSLNQGINFIISNSNEETPISYTYMLLMNPTYIGIAINNINPVWWGMFFAGLIGHNGRMTLYFIPFMINEAVKRVKTPQAWVIVIIGTLSYAVILNFIFFIQTINFINQNI